MNAPLPPSPIMSPTEDRMLLVRRQLYPSITRVATPFLRLAGVRVEPANHSKHDTPGGYGITECATEFSLVAVPSGTETPVPLPQLACPQEPLWSPDGSMFAFANIAATSVELWLGDARTGAVHRVPAVALNPMFGDDLQWMPDSKTLLVKLVPAGLGQPPQAAAAPIGPAIQETGGSKGQSSTYENRDTLGNLHDEDLFDFYAQSQLALIDTSTAGITPLGKPANLDSVAPAPDGLHLLVASLHKPYSYVTTYDRFPREVEVWDISNRSQPVPKTIASIPLTDRVPIRGVPLGPRDFVWRPTESRHPRLGGSARRW